MSELHIRETRLGKIQGLRKDKVDAYLGVTYAHAERFTYATPVSSWEGTYDATRYGNACIQNRTWYAHLEIPERMFYHKEFREGIEYTYDEDCLNLNIFTPKEEGTYPVIVFIHGGGFNSGANYDSAIDGEALAAMGIVCVTINYRVSIFGYFTHEEVKKANGHEGNFGLDDQRIALTWIKEHINDFGGDQDNITVMGQSAGAISIQYLCLSEKCRGLFNRVVMMSGGGMFPKFALPREASSTRDYWLELMDICGANTFEEFQQMDAKKLFDGIEVIKTRRKDNTYCTMPVIDDYLLTAPIPELIKNPLPIDYMLGYTNNDMFAYLLGKIAHKYAKQQNAYLYYFDMDAPGDDNNGAFHSADIRYMFGTLDRSHRPYTEEDAKISHLMMEYIVSYATTGDPNGGNRPRWERGGKKALCLAAPASQVHMGRPGAMKLIHNTLTKGDPT